MRTVLVLLAIVSTSLVLAVGLFETAPFRADDKAVERQMMLSLFLGTFVTIPSGILLLIIGPAELGKRLRRRTAKLP